MRKEILVTPLHVAPMPNVTTECVRACRNIKEILTEVVDLNVYLILIARKTKHVLEVNVSILVLESVVRMQNARL